MNKNLPCGSKLLNSIWKKKEQKLHRQKLKNVKASIQIEEPTRFNHVYKK